MRTTVVAPVVAMWLLGSSMVCGPHSQLSASSAVILTGTVQSESGGAAAATPVKLIRHPDALQAIGQVFVAVGSIGLACIAGRLDICSSFEDATSGGDGSYTFALRGADTQGSVGQALTFTSFAACPAGSGNCAVASDFFIQKTALTIPSMRFWTETGALADDADGNSSLSGRPSRRRSAALRRATIASTWSPPTARCGGRRTPRARRRRRSIGASRRIGRRSGTSSPSARRPATAPTSRSTGTRSSRTIRTATPRRISRGADCYTQGADGMPALLARPCPLTDGDMTTRFAPADDDLLGAELPADQQLDDRRHRHFASARAARALRRVDVERSGDGDRRDLGRPHDLDARRPRSRRRPIRSMPLTTTARFVRLRLSDPTAQWSAAGNGEVAVFSPF